MSRIYVWDQSGKTIWESLGLEEDEKSPARSENLSLAGTQWEAATQYLRLALADGYRW